MVTAIDNPRIRLSALALPSDAEPAFVHDVRKRALARFRDLGFPTTKTEAWKYTNVAPLARIDFALGAGGQSGSGEFLDPSVTARAAAELVFVNGRFAPELSKMPSSDELRVSTIREGRAEVVEHFARHADYDKHPFTALNTALAQDGAVLTAVGVVEGFIHLVFIGSEAAEPVMSHPRNLVVAERGSQITVVESYAGSGTYFTNAVTELVAGDGAAVDHYRIVRDSAEAFHVGTLQVRQERSSDVTSHTITLGGGLVRNEINVELSGEGASCVLDGLFVLAGSQHADNHTLIDHTRPHCTSLEHFKGILDGNGRGIFDGTIIVRPDAQKTSSRQTNNNLLLSETAIVDSKPTLEIHADDVKCNHGSTIGQLDEEALFYLRARGIGEVQARDLLVLAFASEIVDRIKVEPVREQIRRTMFQHMPNREGGRRETRS
ncbi:MAG TPA: Fe-S cluster assembly protein SufD [Thermoanaerobaculia bacterium]|nr:Fe-S cluster assembly protein SufD [Thermoanaerobaculia bacterium]